MRRQRDDAHLARRKEARADGAPEGRGAVHRDNVAHVVDLELTLDEHARAEQERRNDGAADDADPRLDDVVARRRCDDAANR